MFVVGLWKMPTESVWRFSVLPSISEKLVTQAGMKRKMLIPISDFQKQIDLTFCLSWLPFPPQYWMLNIDANGNCIYV